MDELDGMPHNREDDAICNVGGNEISVGDCDDVVSGDEIEDIEVGKEFDSLDDCYNFYRNYGRQKGFGVFKRDSKRGDDGVERWVTYACYKARMQKNRSKSSLNPRLSVKTNCKAKINVVLQPNGKFKLTTACLEHNHVLSPTKIRYMRCNKRLDPYVKRKLDLNDRAGIRINKNFNSLVVEAGGVENLSFDEKDYRNFIVRERQLRLGKGDRAALQDYFNRMQEKESGFFYAIDLDDDNRLRNVFWADARSRATFEAFGDVVTFDTTYLTNKYNMPFAPFVGVNHHGNSVLLGCGLLSNEDTNTFRWLFETWLLCMDNCPPKAIITDQCKAMQNAIEIVFPDTRHRWCLWHIMKKIPEKLRGYDQYKAIKKDLKICVYETFTKDEFDDRWREMIVTYDLDGNEWLKGLYAERRRWVPIYLKDTFFAGMSTTQRSESVNAFFDGYVNSKTTLKQFVEQYDNALRNKIEKENKADYHSFNSQYNCVTRYAIEKQFQEAYTNAKFSDFQVELLAKLYCHISSEMKEGPIFRCKVIEDVQLKFMNKDVVFDVYLNEEEVEVNCTCQLFEFKGILCRHSLAVLTLRKVSGVPKQYILDRWRKDIKREYKRMVRGVDGCSARPHSKMQDKMFHEYLEVANVVGDCQERCDMVISNLRHLKEQFMSSEMVGDSTQAADF